MAQVEFAMLEPEPFKERMSRLEEAHLESFRLSIPTKLLYYSTIIRH